MVDGSRSGPHPGTIEGRFRVTYCAGGLSRSGIEGVGYDYCDPEVMTGRLNPERLEEGWNDVEGEKAFFVSNPGQGLWAYRGDFVAASNMGGG